MTLLLRRDDVLAVVSPLACIAALEDALRRSALGEVPPAAILGMQAPEGSFHVKAGLLPASGNYFAAKVNANFPRNPARSGLPTIQGAVLLFDADDGRLLAILDSVSLTALRTAAATAVAAKHLSRVDSATVLLCGCGMQAPEQLRALRSVRDVRRVLCFDTDGTKSRALAERTRDVQAEAVDDLHAAARASDIVVTCTPSKSAFFTSDMVAPGTFIAAVGADNEDKHEIAPDLMAHAKVVTDATAQACRIGDLHHAIGAGLMTADDVHAELQDIVCGRKAGRSDAEEIIVFDSTGTGLQDVAAAVAAYVRAVAEDRGTRHSLDGVDTAANRY